MYLTRDAIAATLAALGGLAPGSEVIADYILPAELRDDAGAVYGSLVAQASAERGEPWLSCLAPQEMAHLARAAGFISFDTVDPRYGKSDDQELLDTWSIEGVTSISSAVA